MWQQFHQLRYSEKLLKGWNNLLNNLHVKREVEEEVFLFQHLLEEVFKLLIKDVIEKDLPTEVNMESQPDMGESEEQALRYCAGYVPQKLTKRYAAIKNNSTAYAYVNILKSWTLVEEEDASSLLEYTTLWLQRQNRGGLFKINDEVFIFFRAMEDVVRSCLQKTNIALSQTSDIQASLFNKFLESKDIRQKWDNLTGPLSDEAKGKLFQEVCKCFLKMRCEAFIRAYMIIRKDSDMQATRKGEKALRKQLNT
ncbi:hypothetical protein HOLleu_00776 [Holothuria leucospilota]|uniref:Uncharacterized protein n=1 Tax=Holothuria leucospilota TaxID=206669 RepID=A0A9Q1HKF8_HOLLE|nr:hypothetical protein HOLleu_00776 [Holothuria leucospilota]